MSLHRRTSSHFTTSDTLQRIDQLLSQLIEKIPSLGRLADTLPDQDLTREILEVCTNLDFDLPVIPPEGLADQSNLLSRKPEWNDLLKLLKEDWESPPTRTNSGPLSSNELDYLATGLLWATLLINEYKHRFSTVDHMGISEAGLSHK